jgi:TRAP-type C4-dicarboxylate transport system substrate-binding protein
MKFRSGVAVVAAAVALLAGSVPVQAEDQIRSLLAFPRQLGFAKSYLEWLDKINPQAKGTFQIAVIGGPEAIPTFEQAKALKSGVVDMNLTPASYYPAEVPEIEALVGGNMSPWEARANGGFDLMNQIQQKKMNAYLLAWVEYGPRFNFYLKNQPKTRADGLPDFSGVKLRGAPAYREFMAAMGGTFVNIAAPEVYTALERGTVDGVAWPAVTMMDLGWDKFVKYKIMPPFFNLDIVINVNLDKWKALSAATREKLQAMAIAWEKESAEAWTKQGETEAAELKKRGVQDFVLSPDAGKKYEALATETVFTRIKGRDPSNVDAVRAKFVK